MRTKIYHIKQSEKLGKSLVDQEVTVKGWVRTTRDQKAFAFVELNDGSTVSNLQVVIDASLENYQNILEDLTTGASAAIVGKLVASPGKNQSVELHASKVEVIGTCDPETYPLQKKRHSLEFLRSIAHLRPRTNTIGAVTRVRNALAFATHQFFQERLFLYVHTPLITASDCEGAGEMFRVTTLLDQPTIPRNENGKVDFRKDFFGQATYLTVSGQLNGEIYACALSDIYTFGPTFRAENSNTSRHLAEFWMIEPEMAFADLKDDMDCAEAYLQYVIRYALEHCEEDLAFFDQWVEKGLVEKLKKIANTPFQRITYTEAIELLQKANRSFEFPVKWGENLQSEHERYLAEEYFQCPVIVINYPKEIKSFYMRENEDKKTVAAMDILVPGIGEIIGGSQREDRLDVLEQKIASHNLDAENYWWYLELRKYGSTPHAGFGLGFERLIRLVTGIENIRDVIPFPRYPGNATF